MSTLNKLFFAFLVLAFSGSSNASVTTFGSSVKFTYDDSLAGLFSVSGDSLTFTPSNFSATSLGLNGGTFSDSNFAVQIDSLYGHVLESVALNEAGKYSLRGVGAEVLAIGSLSAVDLTGSNSFSNSGDISLDESGTASPSLNNAWTGNASLDLYKSTSVSVSIANLLIAFTTSPKELASINESFIRLNAATSITAVPLPLAVWMFGGGLLGMLSMSKRRNFI
jgi:hypothetical protein